MCDRAMLTRIALCSVCVLVLVSVILSSIMTSIHVDYDHYATGGDNIHRARNRLKRLREQYGRLDDSPGNVMWFLQISDIHISIFRDHSRIAQFQQFCDHTVRRISPHVVLATGDLTDAKKKDNMGSEQIKMEWVYYKNIIKESGVTEHTVWLDIRGNHDNFNLWDAQSKDNYYYSYSVQGPIHARSYIHRSIYNGVDVAFLGMDACTEPGLRRPFNFIGILDSAEVKRLEKLQEIASQANHTIWFGHYPTSTILWLNDTNGSARELIGKTDSTLAYICGHLHTMGGLVPHMYTMQKSQYLELELADWKDNRVYRLVAIDHGLLSFVDQKYNNWPVVLVTNPKHALYALPEREPLEIMAMSSHIRMLVFSDASVEKVKVSVDKGEWIPCKSVQGPLYACEWKPQNYLTGVHNLEVLVKDAEGKEKHVNQPFSLDGTKLQFDMKPRLLLMTDACVLFQTLFSIFLTIAVVPLVMLRLQKTPPQCRKLCSNLARRLWILSKVDRVYYPLILYAVYLPFGPWAVGELVNGHYGAIFAWGFLVDGVFLPGCFTYVYGSVQLCCCHIPLVLVIAGCLEKRLSPQRKMGLRKLMTHLPFILLLSFQMVLAHFFWMAYGTVAFFLGPLRSWSVLLSIYLWYKAMTLPSDYCRKLEKMLLPTS